MAGPLRQVVPINAKDGLKRRCSGGAYKRSKEEREHCRHPWIPSYPELNESLGESPPRAVLSELVIPAMELRVIFHIGMLGYERVEISYRDHLLSPFSGQNFHSLVRS